ncbi:hypothetical protein LWI29_036057 [Acer saccharum]|uniref:Uncharacterized protein n=1 Tax=Acer saccharum TaxID=4024 RepID=A0AA39SAD8_ACESA|nr:hypothetical protein LWI29_036057 [Acer saccharum]
MKRSLATHILGVFRHLFPRNQSSPNHNSDLDSLHSSPPPVVTRLLPFSRFLNSIKMEPMDIVGKSKRTHRFQKQQ